MKEEKTKEVELIIRMPEDRYNAILKMYDTFPAEWREWGLAAIRNGIKIPEGHGDIVDMKTLADMFWDGNSMEITKDDLSVIKPLIEADAPKRRKGIPLEENDSGYNCENWIP